ncbi:ABC transporter substrate-binding protein [Actinomadura sp. WMMB 499]|uniref:ABC transporter substrate-binding protein n=1 Tax=Actinomadura sp. WMMB 499 TaxID=1219491 RepID=UPI001244E3F5|nr:ABC transporter substrate-binding protein [Actinomadura sp. WMMB 499]QFG22274.1 ABC transporter substrate-binding protein [Actinomadura sp. WMMB 499]
MRRTCALLTAVATLAAITACGTGDGRTELTFAVADQTLSAATASYATVPETMGYFEDEGLKVEMQPVKNAVAAIQAVANERATCTYGSTANAVTAIGQDPGLVIVGTVNGNIFRTVAPASAGLRTMADLAGKTVGVNVRGGINEMLVTGATSTQPQPVTGDDILAVGYGAQAAQALQRGDVDAYSGYDSSNLIVGELLGEELVEIESRTDGLTGTSSLVCRKRDVRERPEAIAGLFRAFFKGMVFSRENPRAAIEMHWEHFPASKLSGGTAADLATATKILEKRLEISAGPGSAGQYGQQKDEDLQNTLDTYIQYGVIKGVEPAAATVRALTDYSLVPAYNDFDPAEPRREARAWSG